MTDREVKETSVNNRWGKRGLQRIKKRWGRECAPHCRRCYRRLAAAVVVVAAAAW